MKAKSDYIFLSILGVLLINTIYRVYSDDYQFILTNWLALAAIIFVTILRITSPRKGRIALVILLFLSLFNILNFLLGTVSVQTGIDNATASDSTLSINPLIFIILIAYYLVNRKSILNLIYRSKKDIAEEREKKIDFYLKRFERMSPEEFAQTMRYFDDHPPEAQLALKQLQKRAN